MKVTAILVVAFLVLFSGYKLITSAMDKQEVVECLQWKDQAGTYPNFFLSSWQSEQCEAHNIHIGAPVR